MKYRNLEINDDLKSCFVDDEDVKLSKKEFNLLSYLIEHRNKVISRKELYENIWEEEQKSRAVDTAISRIRKKIKNNSKYILTKSGLGYCFIG